MTKCEIEILISNSKYRCKTHGQDMFYVYVTDKGLGLVCANAENCSPKELKKIEKEEKQRDVKEE